MCNPAAGGGRAARLLPRAEQALRDAGLHRAIGPHPRPRACPRARAPVGRGGRDHRDARRRRARRLRRGRPARGAGLGARDPAGRPRQRHGECARHPGTDRGRVRRDRARRGARSRCRRCRGPVVHRHRVARLRFGSQPDRQRCARPGSGGSSTCTARCALSRAGDRHGSSCAWTASRSRSPAIRSPRATPRPTAAGCAWPPTPRLDDGLLDVILIAQLPKRSFLATMPKVFGGTHVAHPAVSVLRGRELWVDADRAVRGLRRRRSDRRDARDDPRRAGCGERPTTANPDRLGCITA